jgi:signal peptidase II
MKSNRFVRNLLIAFILLANIGCDQISKKIVRNTINEFDRIEVIKNHFTILKIENTGAFLSWGESLASPIKFILLSIVPVCALCLGLIFLFTKKTLSAYPVVGLCFMIGGGLGNLFDRVVYGSVTDFLHIDFGFFQTGVFNMADLSIMTGMLILLLNTRHLDEISWKA